MKVHPVTQLFPPMPPEEFQQLKASIQANGQRIPILTWKGEIVDGVHRNLACEELGIPCKQQEWDGQGSLVELVADLNRHRRHLTHDQRAAIAAELAKALEAEAREKQQEGRRKGGKMAGNGRPKSRFGANLPQTYSPQDGQGRQPRPRDVAGEKMGVSGRKVQEAKTIFEKAPELHKKVKNGEMTHAQAKRVIQRQEKEKELDIKAKAASNSKLSASWQIVTGDCIAEMSRIQKGTVRLAFTDPPYNIGIDYGDGSKADLLPSEEYLAWCRDWMVAVADLLTSDGSFWVLINDEYAAEFAVQLEEVGLHRRQWLIWYESFGVNHSRGFNRTHRHLLWYVKDPKRFVFHEQPVLRPSDRQAKYNDPRAQPGGKIWDDVWGVNPAIPRLVDNAKERLPHFPTQLPLALLMPIVACASDPGDLVLDIFSGSATTGVAAIRQSRCYLGIEKSPRFAELSRKRLLVETNHETSGHSKRVHEGPGH